MEERIWINVVLKTFSSYFIIQINFHTLSHFQMLKKKKIYSNKSPKIHSLRTFRINTAFLNKARQELESKIVKVVCCFGWSRTSWVCFLINLDGNEIVKAGIGWKRNPITSTDISDSMGSPCNQFDQPSK